MLTNCRLGLQCYSTPFSWKLCFEYRHQLYEIIMTACNAKEENEWTKRLSEDQEHPTGADVWFAGDIDLDIESQCSLLSKGTKRLELRSYRKTDATSLDTVTSTQALQASASRGCLSQKYVVLKNTTTLGRESSISKSSSGRVYRSKSLLTPSQMTVLTPAKADRTRLESLVRDVWSRKVLPFPGMVMRSRSENIMRTSASSMMRKLSVAGIASSLSKRSSGVEQITPQSIDNGMIPSTESLRREEYGADRTVKRQKPASAVGAIGPSVVMPSEAHDPSHHNMDSPSDKSLGRLLAGGIRLWPVTYKPLSLSRYISTGGNGADEDVRLPIARRSTFSEIGQGRSISNQRFDGLFP